MAAESSKHFRMIQEGWFSGDTKVLRGDVLVARFSFGSWKTQGKISFDDVNYEVVRPKGLGTLLRLQRDGVAVCETRIGGMWSRRAELKLDGVRYLVTWPAFDAKTVLKRGDVEVGFVGKWRTWAREAEGVFVENVPTTVCVFVMWLAIHKRRMDSAD
jgi:hypothetical protein